MPMRVVNEVFTSGTTTTVANTPVIAGTFMAICAVGDTITHTITESGIPVSGVVNLTCDTISGFTGTLNYVTGEITMTNLPAGSTTKMYYNYTDSTPSANDITNQFIDALKYVYSVSVYPKTYNKFWEEFSDHDYPLYSVFG